MRWTRGAALVAIVLASGCEFGATNPYDPEFALKITLTGPDTATSIGDVVTFRMSTTPAVSVSKAVWTSSDARLASLGNGQFRVVSASYYPFYATVSAALGGHQAERTIIVRQRVASISIRDPAGNPVDSLQFDAYGQTRVLALSAYDSLGSLVGVARYQYLFYVGDLHVMEIVNYEPQSVADGRTWLVVSLDEARDSMPVVVRQLPASFVCSPPSPISMALNDSLQLGVARWVDSTGHQVDSLPQITSWVMDSLAVPGYGAGQSMEVTPAGMVYSNANANTGTVDVQWRTPDGTATGQAGACVVTSS